MHSNFRCVRTIVAAVVFLVGTLSSSSLLAQTTFGSIVGNAKDPSAAVVPGVSVTVTSAATGLAREATTNPSGDFAVLNLLPGTYIVTAKLEGFKTWTASGIEVRLNQATTMDITMELGLITQFVEVTGAVPLLQTVEATVGHVVDQRRVSQLPLSGRDFTQLTLLIPGAAPASLPGGFFVIGGQPVAVSGNRPDQNNYTLDGTYNNETFFKHYGLRPSVDAIQEFNIQTNITSSRYGVGGAHVDIATRSGSNTLHGSVFEFLRNDNLDANDYFRFQGKRPDFKQNNFGATIGGPIWIPKLYKGRDKTFFFFNYEGLRRLRESTSLGIVPTPAMLAGDLSVDQAGRPIPQIYNPFTTCGFGTNPACATDAEGNPILTRQPFPNNQIPAGMLDPVSKVYSGMFYGNNPPNRAATLTDPFNLINTKPLKLDTNQYTARVDHRLSDKDTLFARFSYSDIPLKEPLGLPTQVRNRSNGFRNLTISDTHVFNPTTVLEFRYGYSRDNISFNSIYPAPGFQAVLDAGLSGLPAKFIGFDTPLNLNPSGFTGADMFVFANGPDRNHQFIGNIMKIKGRHTFNTGLEIKRAAMFHDGQFANWAFTSDATADPQNRATTGYGLASYLLGLPAGADRLIGNAALDARATNYHFYLQDDIKLTSKLTMNIGARYEWSQWFRFVNDTVAGFDMTNGQFVWAGYNYVWGMPANTRRTFIDPDFNNFAPRIGFAYRLGDKTTIRAGYGVFFAALMTWEASQNRGNWPYSISQTLSGLNIDYPERRFTNVFPSVDLAAATPATQHTNNRNDRWPYIQQWNFHLQRELTKDLLLEVGYLGNKGTKLSSFVSANDPRPGPGEVGSPQHPRPWNNNTAMSMNFMGNNSRYHALQAKVERRFTSGLSLLTSYAWSHNIDMSSTFGGDTCQDWYNRKETCYGNSSFDLRHNLVVSSIYQLPFGPGRRFLNFGGPGGKILEGWDIAAIVSVRSGFPYGIGINFDNANVGSRGAPQRPDLVGSPNLPESERSRTRWFNTDAFQVADSYAYGNLGRNTMIGPGFRNFDLALHKTTKIHESQALEFRVEMFNAFNNVNLGNPGGTLGTGGFGVITGTQNTSREIQFALKYIF